MYTITKYTLSEPNKFVKVPLAIVIMGEKKKHFYGSYQFMLEIT